MKNSRGICWNIILLIVLFFFGCGLYYEFHLPKWAAAVAAIIAFAIFKAREKR